MTTATDSGEATVTTTETDTYTYSTSTSFLTAGPVYTSTVDGTIVYGVPESTVTTTITSVSVSTALTIPALGSTPGTVEVVVPYLKPEHKYWRKVWCSKEKSWNKVCWSDEVTFEIGEDGSIYYVTRSPWEEYLD